MRPRYARALFHRLRGMRSECSGNAHERVVSRVPIAQCCTHVDVVTVGAVFGRWFHTGLRSYGDRHGLERADGARPTFAGGGKKCRQVLR